MFVLVDWGWDVSWATVSWEREGGVGSPLGGGDGWGSGDGEFGAGGRGLVPARGRGGLGPRRRRVGSGREGSGPRSGAGTVRAQATASWKREGGGWSPLGGGDGWGSGDGELEAGGKRLVPARGRGRLGLRRWRVWSGREGAGPRVKRGLGIPTSETPALERGEGAGTGTGNSDF